MQSIQKNLNASRDAIKGFAILWVVFFHAQLGLSGVLYDIQKIGYGGVDIFMFLSGYGLYHSLNKDNDLGRYLKRRAFRLLPVYLPFCLLWLAVMVPIINRGRFDDVIIRIIAGNLTMMGLFSGAPSIINWYVSLLLITVLLAPVFYVCIQPGKRYWVRVAALMLVLFVIGVAYVKNDENIVFSRLPVFVLGMVFASPFKSKVSKGVLHWGLLAAFAMGMAILYLCFTRYPDLLIAYAMYWYPFVLITPGLCVGLGWLIAKCPSVLCAPLKVLGKASFEIFLFNVWLEVLGKHYGLTNTPAQWAIGSLIMLVLGSLYHWIVNKIVQKVVDKRV